MSNKIYILDTKKINDTEYIIRLIKRYHITLLNLFPKVLDVIIREYVDDIIEVNINDDLNIHERPEYTINVNYQFINCIPISFLFRSDHQLDRIRYHGIAHQITSAMENNFEDYGYMWKIISNEYMEVMYKKNKYYENISDYQVSYAKNILEYDCTNVIQIHNHKLFKNIIIMMQIIFEHLKKKLISKSLYL